MTDNKKLKNPPIVEALVEIRWSDIILLNQENISLIKNLLQFDGFLFKELRNQQSVSFQFGVGKSPIVEDFGPSQIVFGNEDSSILLNIFSDKIVINNTKTYIGWEKISPLVIKILKLIREKFNFGNIVRIGVRYINNLQLLLSPPQMDFNYYLKSPPAVPAGIPNTVIGFLNRSVIFDSDSSLTCILILSYDHNISAQNIEKRPVMLDIDTISSEVIYFDENILTELLLKISKFKNNVFFKSLTENCVRNYE